MHLVSRGKGVFLGDYGFLVLAFWLSGSGFYLWEVWFLLPNVLAIFIAKTPRKQVVGLPSDLFTVG